MTTTIQLVYCPFPSVKTARAAATRLIEGKLAACCNLLPAGESLYLWQGALTTETELVLIAKTSVEKAPSVVEAITQGHPYECPAILRLPAEANDAFAQWVAACLKE